jgi:hypothetical protein
MTPIALTQHAQQSKETLVYTAENIAHQIENSRRNYVYALQKLRIAAKTKEH